MWITSTRNAHAAVGVAAALVVALAAAVATAAVHVDSGPSATLRNWDVDAGLPSPRVYAIAHTPDGHVWLATYAGLCRFDGVDFTTLTPSEEPALGSAVITALAVDGDGVLWVGTDGGHLCIMGRQGFEAIVIPEIAGRRITAIQPRGDGGVWLASRGGVFEIVGESVRPHGGADGLESADVRNLVLDCDGAAWALAGGTVHRFDGDRWTRMRLDGVHWWDITSIAPAASGGVWCAEKAAELPDGRGSRVFRATPEGAVADPIVGPWPRNPDRSRIDALVEDPAGRVWCATRGAGTYCRGAKDDWWIVGETTSLARADGIAFASDRHGDVWIGTRSNGVYQAGSVFVRTARLPDSPEALKSVVVTSVAATDDGGLWAGTDGGGVVCWREGAVRTFGLDAGLPSLTVAAVASGGGDRLYAATTGGLVRFDGERFEAVSLGGGGRPICECLLPESDGLWVGTREATFQVGPDGPREVRRVNDESLPTICLTRDASGRIVALDRTGTLYVLADGGFDEPVVESPEPFPGGRALAADPLGGLWIGSYGSGLARLAEGRLRRWTQQDSGLPSSHVVAIVESAGVLWVGSENGIYGCPVATFAESQEGEPLAVWRVTQAEGLPEKLCTARRQPSACVAADGTVWMPNGRWVAGFRPADAMSTLDVFPPQVEWAMADGANVPLPAFGPVLLPVGVRRLEFGISSPNTVAPHRLVFRHRLAGFDEEWVEIGGRRVASYTGVPPGDYRLEVEVRGPHGAWQGLGEAYPFRIPPGFWERRDVQATMVAGLAGLVAAAGWAGERRRSKRRLERMRLEQARDQERQRIARDIHDDIGSGLTEIVMLSHLASREQGNGDPGSAIHRIEDRARRLTRSMDEVVWAINPRNDSLEGFITYFHRWAQAFLSNAGLRVRWDLPLEPTEAALPAEVRHQLLLACKEAVTNIVKHAGATEVRIACRPRPDGLGVVIEDDGKGFADADLEAGRHGLDNLRSRLAEVGGRCEIDSMAGRGTRVFFDVETDRRTIGATP